MYDPRTRALIQSGPPLGNLNLERLPEEMTNAYASIVSFRLRVRQAGPTFPEELLNDLERFRRLANTYEAYVALLPDGEHKVSAAFVSASAHHLVNRADRLRTERIRRGSELARNYITSDISALLLFLIAEYQADAAEMAKQLRINGQPPIERALLTALRGLAEGTLDVVVSTEPEGQDEIETDDLDTLATRELYFRLFRGVQDLAALLLGDQDRDPIGVFRSVQSDSVAALSFADLEVSGLPEFSFVSAFSGPHQLATLLIQAGGTLLGQSVINLPPPEGLGEIWQDVLKALARRRPYLWPNHIEALKTTVLNRGTSAVISLPTGAGKTTMAELKIASALASGTKVIYLVPTHALADQVRAQLGAAFPDYKVTGSALAEGHYAEIGEDDLPPLMVMTPERCLTLLGVLEIDFRSLGLVVFDECHLMHPRKGYAERRSIDAVLCLLKLFEKASDADFLLMSAMVSNFQELADWIADVTGRPAIALGIEWKPTRQARGCLVFKDEELDKLNDLLAKEKKAAIKAEAAKPKKDKKRGTPAPGVAVKRQLNAHPLGFFCLRQTWNKKSVDYAVLPLSEDTVPLAANAQWFITPNKNTVAIDLGSRFAALGIKTLVFIQNKGHCESVASGVAEILADQVTASPLTKAETHMLLVAIQETGSPSAVLGSFDRLAVCHHGLLLPVERHLTESMFCRADGPALLTATPTLAQGMNLPAEVVIIAGDVRREEGSTKATPLEAHELLNAAGRAGRAGHVADGVVLVIPEDVVSINVDKHRVGGNWMRLNETVFAKSDQCLKVDDPIDHILDLIQVSADPSDTLIPYVVRRLPRDEDGGNTGASMFLSRSLAAYRAKRSKRSAEFDLAVSAILNYRRTIEEDADTPAWMDQLSVSSGVSIAILASIDEVLHGTEPLPEKTTSEWVEWFFDWLELNPSFARQLFDCWELSKVLKDPLEKNKDLQIDVPQLLKRLRPLVRQWVNADTLTELEKSLQTPDGKIGTCDRARELVIRRLPEISYALGLFTQVHRGRLESAGRAGDMPLNLATLAPCIREGHRSPVHLAIRYVWGSEISRSECHNVAMRLGVDAEPQSQNELFSSLLRRVGRLVRNLS